MNKIVNACLTLVRHGVFLFTSFGKPFKKKIFFLSQNNNKIKLLLFEIKNFQSATDTKYYTVFMDL